MNVPGTSMHPVDVAGGVALEFSTTSDVTDLRRRVARMAEMHNRGGAGGMTSANMMDGGMMQGQGMMDGGMMGNGMMGNGMMGNGMMGNGMMGGGMMGGGMMGIQADARAEDTPQGARLIFTPRDPANLEALRGQAKANANQGCPMMSMH